MKDGCFWKKSIISRITFPGVESFFLNRNILPKELFSKNNVYRNLNFWAFTGVIFIYLNT